MGKVKESLDAKKVYQYFIAPLKEQKLKITAVILSLGLLSLSQSMIILLVGPFINSLFSLGVNSTEVDVIALFPPKITGYFLSETTFFVNKDLLIKVIPAFLLLGGFGKALATFIYQLNQQALSLWVARSYRDSLFNAVLKQTYVKTLKQPASNWMSIIMNDVLFLQNRFSDICNGFIKDTVTVLSAFVVMLFVHWQTALLLLLISPLIAMGMGRVGQTIALYADSYQREMAKMADVILDLRRRFSFLRSQKGEQLELKQFEKCNSNYYNLIKKSILIRSAFAPVLEFLGFFIFAVILFSVSKGYLSQDMIEKNLFTFFVALGMILKPLKNLGEQIAKFQETKGVLFQSFRLLGNAEETSSSEGVFQGNDSDKLSDLEIRNLEVGYNGNVNFRAKGVAVDAGKSIAIVGPSGSGKSTFIKTLTGLLNPQKWESNEKLERVSERVSLVSQNPFLFQDSIRDNLLYGNKSSKTIDDTLIWQVLSNVGLQEMVEQLPEGLNTPLNAIDSNVSGGQKQRLVVARALLRKFDFLFFDEATSAVDVKTENEIVLNALKYCKEKSKVFVSITHRHQLLEKFDEIWFVEKGEIASIGKHDSLLKNVRYREFCSEGGL